MKFFIGEFCCSQHSLPFASQPEFSLNTQYISTSSDLCLPVLTHLFPEQLVTGVWIGRWISDSALYHLPSWEPVHRLGKSLDLVSIHDSTCPIFSRNGFKTSCTISSGTYSLLHWPETSFCRFSVGKSAFGSEWDRSES